MSGKFRTALTFAVIGGSGKTGRLVIEQLLGEGHNVRAISRSSPKALTPDGPGRYEFVNGDVSKDNPARWMVGMNAMIFTAAGEAATENEVDHLGAARCAHSAKETGVQRFVLVSAHGAHDPASWGPEFRSYLEAKAAGEEAVRAILPKAIVLRPGILTDDPATGKVTIRRTTGSGERPVTRADVAVVVASCATRLEAQAITLEIVGGDREITDALNQVLGLPD